MKKYVHDRPAKHPGDRSSEGYVDRDRIPHVQHGRRGDEGSHTGSSPPRTRHSHGPAMTERERRERWPTA